MLPDSLACTFSAITFHWGTPVDSVKLPQQEISDSEAALAEWGFFGGSGYYEDEEKQVMIMWFFNVDLC